jgi:hypothetical protein
MAREEGFFDDLARGLADGSISRRGALKLFAGSALAALIPSRALAQQQKVTICHKPGTPDQKTIEVSNSALHGHQAHGDTLGACGESTTTTTTAAPTTTTTSTTSTTPMCLPPGESCTADDECCSRVCVEGREGGLVCAAAPPICDPPCPANCSCDFAADGTTTCIGCPPGLPCLISDAADCAECTRNGLVCVAGVQPGFVGCAPACTVSTTSTSTSTTSTSTSTTSTSTTSPCLPDGASCTGDSLCCSGTICCAVSNLEAQCLTEPGGSCTADTQCCGNAVGFGFCQNGTCCSANGGICTSDTDCCGDLHCDNGDCVL